MRSIPATCPPFQWTDNRVHAVSVGSVRCSIVSDTKWPLKYNRERGDGPSPQNSTVSSAILGSALRADCRRCRSSGRSAAAGAGVAGKKPAGCILAPETGIQTLVDCSLAERAAAACSLAAGTEQAESMTAAGLEASRAPAPARLTCSGSEEGSSTTAAPGDSWTDSGQGRSSKAAAAAAAAGDRESIQAVRQVCSQVHHRAEGAAGSVHGRGRGRGGDEAHGREAGAHALAGEDREGTARRSPAPAAARSIRSQAYGSNNRTEEAAEGLEELTAAQHP